ncbi:hypothetical protein LG634_07550 [Streptomyces bambusae]|uniref:hypothetical protein n=1 Tax=Streptomyces bambusae TaxID=1550616 RepID=UPI001CFCA3B4|nr:hypothetical protein [Streptomyces bambusae]MCB5164688.1 hypothetical protein [Streptomyces bambusae]
MRSQLSPRRTAMFVMPAFAGLLLGGVGAPSAHAATIDVPCTTSALTNAVNQANADPDPTTLRLARNCVYSYAAGDPSAPATALPHITTPVAFNGRQATITRAEGAPLFRLLAIDGTGGAELKDLTLSNGDIVNEGGGAVFNGGTLTISNCRLIGNTVRSENGGAVNNFGSLRITSSVLRGNSVVPGPNPGGGGGGAVINNFGAVARIEGSVLTGNSSFRDGGAVNNGSGTFTLTGGLLAGNEGRAGGAIANGGTFTLTGATLTGNTATLTNGGAITNGGFLTTRLVAVTHNTAAVDGGGILNGGVLDARSTRIESNAATTGTGGGIVNRGGTAEATLTGSRVTRNTAAQAPAGIHNDGGLVTLRITLVAGNTPGNCAGSSPAVGGCTG